MVSLEPLRPDEVRVGDAERRAVDARLQEAVGAGVLDLHEYDERAALAFSARTRGDLAPLTRDLPGAPAGVGLPGPAPAVTAAVGPWAAGHAARPRARWGVAVMSGAEVAGVVAPGQRTRVVSLMGGATVDLRRVDLPPVVDVDAVAVMGGVEVFVPVGARVECSGSSIMGGRDERLSPARPEAPLVRVRAHSLMGGVSVSHGPKRARVEAGAATAELSVAAARVPARRRRQRRVVRGLLGVALLGGLAAGAAGAAVSGDASAVFGSSEVQVSVPGQTRDYDAGVLFGSVEIRVNRNVLVHSGGTVVFGSSECPACASNPPSGPTLQVHARGGFGSVRVVREGDPDTGGG